MAKIEDQRILIWCNHTINIRQTIIDVAYLALKLEKEVCLFANYSSEKEKNFLQERINRYACIVKDDVPQLEVSTLLLKGKLYKLMKELGEKYNSIMLCSGGKCSNTLIKAFYHSGFPLYFARENKSFENKFKNIIIPLDFRSSTKDSLLWGSYLGRFNKSEITIYKANDKDPDLSQKVEEAVVSVKKLFDQFSFNYKFTDSKGSSWKIHTEASKKLSEFDLMVFTGSRNVSLPDRIIGSFEKRIVNNEKKKSILLINPQVEMFVICS